MTDDTNAATHATTLDEDTRRQVFVVIAAYNEADAIGPVLDELAPRYPNTVVVDDGSSDDTARIARERARHTLRHPINRGQGAALQTGIDFALRRGARYIVTFDADGQHRTEDIPRILEPLLNRSADIALGSRFLEGADTNLTPTRRLTLKLAVLFTRAVNRVNITDTHNGFRAFTREAAHRISISADRMAHASEILDLVRRSRLPYTEVPVSIRYTEYSRAKGQSSLAAFRILLHYFLARVFER